MSMFPVTPLPPVTSTNPPEPFASKSKTEAIGYAGDNPFHPCSRTTQCPVRTLSLPDGAEAQLAASVRVNWAVEVVRLPEVLVNTAWYSSSFSDGVDVKLRVVVVAPLTLFQ